MLDYAITLAPELHETLRQARAYEAEKRTWLRRYRAIERAERRDAKTQHPVSPAMAQTTPAVLKMWI
ncbi:MAG TPA: hypothetical protein VFY79_14295 [Dehalococcoidia bacterium]|nr:hypothetical protein [Dehalococcoidia bacterium]